METNAIRRRRKRTLFTIVPYFISFVVVILISHLSAINTHCLKLLIPIISTINTYPLSY
nr:MAG TPA: hypothetical protein [Caudoviricetes sp.]